MYVQMDEIRELINQIDDKDREEQNELKKILRIIDQMAQETIISEEQRGRIRKTLKALKHGGQIREPKRFSLSIKDVSEKAFQRAIYLSCSCCFNYNDKQNEVLWGDLEVPASCRGVMPRGSCFDLVGKCNNKYVFCELKFGKKGDRPFFAVLELLTYYAGFIWNEGQLCFHSTPCISIAELLKWNDEDELKKKKPFLIVAADSVYWEGWKQDREEMNRLKEISRTISQLCLLEVPLPLRPKEFFVKQKSTRTLYTPCLGCAKDWEIVQL